MRIAANDYPFFRAASRRGIARRPVWMVIFLLCATVFSAAAQDDLDYSVHANIIYHFTKYVDWPQDKKTGDFVIGIVGDSPLFDELQQLAKTKKAGTQPIVVKKIPPSATSFNCHILFISEEAANRLKKIVALTAGSPVLLVSESEGLAQKGSCINFCIVKEKLRLEINKSTVEEHDLHIASELLKLAILVK